MQEFGTGDQYLLGMQTNLEGQKKISNWDIDAEY